MGKGKSQSQTQTSESNPWGPAQDQLKDILGKAKEQFDKTGGLDGNWVDRNYPDLNDDMKNALGNLASSGNLGKVADQLGQMSSTGAGNINTAGDSLGQFATGGKDVTGEGINKLAGELYDNETVKSQQEQLGKDVQHGLDKNVNQLNQQAGASGNMGSSRAGVAQGVMTGKSQEAYAKGAADIDNAARNQAYGQAMGTLQQNKQNQLSGAGALGNLGMGQGNLANQSGNWHQQMLQNQMGAGQYGQNRTDQGAMNDWFNQMGKNNAGWDNLGKYLNMTGAIGGMGGTQTGTSTSKQGGSWFNDIMGAASTGAGIMGAFSDASMKKNVKRTGKSKTGHTTYKWDWNESAKKQGMKGKGSGVLAQQEAKENPKAVGKDPVSGRLKVDYDKTDVKPTGSKKKKGNKGR